MTEATDEVIDDVTDVTEYDDTTDDGDNPTVDDYKAEKARRIKAEKTLVEQKRKLKELEGKSSESSDIMTKADYAMEKFLDKNPELSEYTKELESYTKKGLSLEDAKTLVLNSDKAKQNREKTNSLGLSDGEPNSQKTTVSKSELEKLAKSNIKEYNRIRDLMDSGNVTMR